jgi:hypothetical protein
MKFSFAIFTTSIFACLLSFASVPADAKVVKKTKSKNTTTSSKPSRETAATSVKSKTTKRLDQESGATEKTSTKKFRRKKKTGATKETAGSAKPSNKTENDPTPSKATPRPEELPSENETVSSVIKEPTRSRFGIAASILTNKMTANYLYAGKTYTANMSGGGYGLVGFYDRQFSGPFSGRLMVGIEQFSVTKDQYSLICDGGKSTICELNLTNLSLYGQGKITIMPRKFPVWVAGGVGGWIPISKKSTVFESSSLGPMLVFVISAGVDVPLFGQRLPVFLDYVYMSGSASVSGDSFILRVGYSWK